MTDSQKFALSSLIYLSFSSVNFRNTEFLEETAFSALFFSEKEDETSYHISHGHRFGHRLPGCL